MTDQTKEYEHDELAHGTKPGPPLAEDLKATYNLPFKFNEKTGVMRVYKEGKWKRCCLYCPKGANYPGLCGRKRVCATHAKAVGSHQVQNPCRDCPVGNKLEAHYPDENGKPKSLCATHAKAVGSHQVLCPCRDCPVGNKLEAAYPDENGKPESLCAEHAKAVGSHQVRNPCRDCPVGNKLEAHYPDQDGNLNRLCARHAVLAGTHIESKSGASVVACECFDRWERLTGERIGHRVRYMAFVGGSRAEGREMRGLIPDRRIQPDGYQEETKTVWLFHGNYFHGYPPDHAKYETRGIGGKWGPDLYKATMEQMALYVKHGYTVKYVWEHEYLETTRARCPVSLRDVVHAFGATVAEENTEVSEEASK